MEHLREEVFSEFSRETLDDFLAKNREKYSVDPDLNPEGHLICLTEEESGQIFRGEDGWNRFMEEYPKSSGNIELSRVGLDRNLTQAMIYVGHQFHWTAGSGNCYFLSKSDGNWFVEGDLGLWIS
ncbi:MAG: hypothetical protein ACR2KW_05415 [Rubrobacter sp.]